MKHVSLITPAIALGALLTGAAQAGMDDDPVLLTAAIDQMERRHDGNGPDPLVMEADFWIGTDLHKAWLKTEVEQVGGETEELQLELLYSRAIDPYWDFQIGWRGDRRPDPERDWLAIGVMGVAPYWIETEATAYIGENGRTALRLNAEYELMFTQRLFLVPEVEANLYGKDDPARNLGSGLSNVNLGLRLHYGLTKQFAPYIGWNWNRKFGDTADFTQAAGGRVEHTQFVMGVSGWF